MTSERGDGPSRTSLIAALIVAVGAAIGVLVVAALMQRSPERGPVAIPTVPAPRADSAECRTLVDALPEQLGDYHRARVVDPAPPGTAAWQTEQGGEALILRCGLDRPVEFVVGAPIQMVDAVQWFRVGEAGVGDDRVGAGSPDERSTWFAVDRPVYVALTLPPGSGPTAIQALSAAIAQKLPATAIDPGPVR